MVKKIQEDSAAMSTLHPGSGSNGSGAINSGGGGVGDVSPDHQDRMASKFGNSMSIDKSGKTDWFNKMIAISKAHYGRDADSVGTNKSSIVMHPSDAVGKAVKEETRKELEALLGEDFAPEFKEKAVTIFEAALGVRILAELTDLEDKYEVSLQEACEEINEEVMNKVETYIEYVAEEWMDQNEVAIENSLQTEVTRSFMEALRNVFLEHNVVLPEGDTDVVDELAAKVAELEGRLADAIEDNAELRKFREGAERETAVAEACEGLTTVEKEKLINLSEGLDVDTIEEFTTKIGVLRESVKPTKAKDSKVAELLEDVNEDNAALTDDGKDPHAGLSPQLKSYVSTIDRLWKQ